MGFIWNQNYKVDIGIINAKLIWYVTVFSIVIGHIFAVYIARVMAVYFTIENLQFKIISYDGFNDRTMLSLWILSQPIVE